MPVQNRSVDLDPGWRGYAYAETDPDRWTTFWRLDPRREPFELADWHSWPRKDWSHPDVPLWGRARTPAGICGRWDVDARAVELDVRASTGVDGSMGQVDVVADGVIVHRQQMETGVQRVRAELPEQAGQVEIWLPQLGDAAVRGLRFAGTATPAPLDRVQWATYGSSITQCGEAAGPADAWPAIVSRRLGWGLRGMGFGGECHLDQAALHELTSRPYDVVSMCLGINIFGAETFNGRSLPGQVATFAGAVARAQPDAAVVVITPIAASAAKEAERNGVGLTLDDIRMCVRLGVETANRTLEKPVHLIAGPDVLGHAETLQYLGDPVHPNPAGYRLMGERLAKILQEIAAC